MLNRMPYVRWKACLAAALLVAAYHCAAPQDIVGTAAASRVRQAEIHIKPGMTRAQVDAYFRERPVFWCIIGHGPILERHVIWQDFSGSVHVTFRIAFNGNEPLETVELVEFSTRKLEF